VGKKERKEFCSFAELHKKSALTQKSPSLASAALRLQGFTMSILGYALFFLQFAN
jgi:hypothetical protein